MGGVADTSGDFVTIVNQATVGKPIAEVWLRIGNFQDLGRFLDVTCELIAGGGAIGSVRLINGALVEPMVGASRYSYTYAQTVGPMSAHAYHGCVACAPLGTAETEIRYTLVYDQSGIAADRREAERLRLASRFAGAVEAMRAAASAPDD